LAVHGPAITIGYSNCLAVAGYSQSLMNAVTNFNWYFAYASVGELMSEGLTNLHLANPSFYQLQSLSCGGSPPSTTVPGVIYGDDRGHSASNNYDGDWQYEVANFQAAVSNGWASPRVNLAMNILSFVDIWYNNSSNGVAALFNGYVSSMTNLEAAFPQTLFVYMTMPITTTNYDFELDTEPEDEYWRCVFNNELRAWCAANNRVLFDIADMEAHDTNGDLCTFTYNGLLCEQLWSGDNQGGDACCGEVGDGAHPSNFAAEELIAKGFYALAAALVGEGGRLTTSISLSTSANPSPSDRAVLLTAAVTGANGTPTGGVQFLTNGVAAGGMVTMTNYVATYVVAALPRGTNTITAGYPGDNNFLGSTTSMHQMVVEWDGTLRFIGLSNGIAMLECAAIPNFGYLVQRSTNLGGSWLTLGTTNAPASGSFQWTDAFDDLGASPRAAFYRLQQP
jgi:hypothetical protein